jgi:hypothetical protein
MPLECSSQVEVSPATQAFYRRVVDILVQAEVPFLVGGAYALARFTGIVRHTKDLDVFLRRHDCARALEACAAQGFRTELTYPHWLGKVIAGDAFVDFIFSSGNALIEVDDGWFSQAVPAEVFGMPVLLCPVEESIWSKTFVMERERYDGADIAHLLRAYAGHLDWPRLLRRFGPHWRLLLANLILFGYIYPAERALIPEQVFQELLGRLHQEQREPVPAVPVCQGTLLSREQYLTDISSWGYQDARLRPQGKMTAQAVASWTAAIGKPDLPPTSNSPGQGNCSHDGRSSQLHSRR